MTQPAPSPTPKWPQWLVFTLIFAGLSVAMGLWYVFALRDDEVTLYRNLSPSDAASVGAALDQENIHYHINNAGDVLVGGSHEAAARRRLTAAHAGPAAVQGFELFDTADMGLTEFAQKIKYQRALQGELERTIMMMDGIVSARVHISEPDHTLFQSEPETAKAAVTLVTRSAAAETPDRIAGIRRLVAASVADLAVSDVVILDAHGDILSSDVEVLTADPNARAAAVNVSPQLLGGSEQSFIDLVTTVVGRAIPHTRFSVAIVPDASGTAGAATNSSLGVTVTTAEALGGDDLLRVREALTLAGQASGKTVSTIVFASDHTSAASNGTGGARRSRNPRPLALEDVALALGSLLLLALIGLCVWLWRKSTERALTSDEQLSFATQLKTALAADGGQSELV